MSEEFEMGPLQKWLQPKLDELISAVRDVCNANNCNCHTTPTEDPVEEPATEEPLFGVVTVDKVALRFAKRYNKTGYPVMIIWNKYEPVAQRRRFEMKDEVLLGDKVRADGGVRYYQVLNDVDGFDFPIPEEPELFIPEWAIDLVD